MLRHTCAVVGFLLAVSVVSVSQTPATSTSVLPDGEGRENVQRICTGCHSLSVVTGQRMTRDHWQREVDDMVSRGAKGTPDEIALTVDYLSKHFGNSTALDGQAGSAETTRRDTVASRPNRTLAELPKGEFVPHGDPATVPGGVTFQRILKANSEPQNWLTFGGTYKSLHYSLLDQITPENAKNLELKWVFQTHWLDPYETTPLVVDGVLYTTQGNDVVALDAATGRLFWIYRYTPVPDARLCCGRITRGLAIYGDTLYLAAVDAHLIAIDAKTGNPLWDTTVARTQSGYTMTGAPLLVKDKVIVGVAGGEYGIRGFIAAYDAKTGKKAWTFYATAGPGDPNQHTWAGDSWKTGGGSTWLTGSYDADTNLLIWGIGNAGPDYNGDLRLGDNLYTSGLVAVDADTGKLKWWYQANPHNEYDWDGVQVPLLADIDWQGQPRKVVLWANRNGFFYVLDRVTGRFLLGKPFVKQTWNAGFDENGRPIMAENTKSSEEGTLIYPDNQGGTNWYGASYSPQSKLFYVIARDGYSTVFVKGPQQYTEGERYDGRGVRPRGRPTPQAVGAADEQLTAIRALDPHTGDRKWEYKLNTGASLNPFGGWQTNAGAAGILTTSTNLLICGGREGNFVVLDSTNGHLLWQTQLGGPMLMNPITYAVDGKQYIAIDAGTSLFVFGLRDGAEKNR
jgi:alcohol dehydrogenase (cytochrome c)